MNQGTISEKVYPKGVQPVRGNNCGLIPVLLPSAVLVKFLLQKYTFFAGMRLM